MVEQLWPAVGEPTAVVDWGRYRAQLARNLRVAGGAMLGLSYLVPLVPSPGTLCPLRRFTGIPCPFCGLTTGVVATSHGHLLAGGAANPVAPLLVMATVVGWLVWGLRRSGRMAMAWEAPAWLWTWSGRALGPALFLVWVFELHRFGFV